MRLLFSILFLCFILTSINLYSQREDKTAGSSYPSTDSLPANPFNKKIKYYEVCFDSLHGRRLYLFFRDYGSIEGISLRKYPTHTVDTIYSHKTSKNSFLKVHGNVLYDLNYYSGIDTPFYQKDVYQHTIQAYLDITVKDHYPVRLYITNRFGNSSFYKKFTDINLLYTSNLFVQPLKEQLKKKMVEGLQSSLKLDSLKKILDFKHNELKALQSWQHNPAILQKLVEAKEQELFNKQTTSNDSLKSKLSSLPSFNNFQVQDLLSTFNDLLDSGKQRIAHDSLLQSKKDSVVNAYEAKKKRIDSLKQEVAALEKKYNELQQKFANISTATSKEIDVIKNPHELQSKMQALHIGDSIMPKGYKTLMALRTVGIGRNIINYSELSVKNISVTGLQVEYNPSYYVAFAAGTVDYRFRDFVTQNYHHPKQYVAVARIGAGMKDGNNVILTYYAGRKQIYNSFTDTINPNTQIVSPYLMGFTIEGNYKVGNNNLITAEVAKSSMPYYRANNKSNSLLSGTVRLNDRSNEAYSIKVASFIPRTNTAINGYYKHFGINFQSYSIFTNGSSQSAFNVRVEQPFFKRTLDIVASVNANDFSNPYIPSGYKSSTVFKSIQATLRKKNWPIISLGYFPTSQLTKLNDDKFIQNLFYTLVGDVNYLYRFHNTLYSTTFLYTQFYNDSRDSGFVYFNTKNLMVNQTIFLNRFTLQLNGSEAVNNYYRLYEAGGNMQFKWNDWLSIGSGIKYNVQTVYNIKQIGYSANATLKIPVLGEFMFMIEKGFIPGANRRLVTNNVGRFTYFKSF